MFRMNSQILHNGHGSSQKGCPLTHMLISYHLVLKADFIVTFVCYSQISNPFEIDQCLFGAGK